MPIDQQLPSGDENPNPILRLSNQALLVYANSAGSELISAWNWQLGKYAPYPWPSRVSSTLLSKQITRFVEPVGAQLFSISLVPVSSEMVNLYGYDITNLVQTEQALAASEKKYRMLFDYANDAIILWEHRASGYQVIEANQAACDRYGYSYEELLSLNGCKLNTLESYNNITTLLRDVLESGGCGTYEMVHKSKSGESIPSEVSGHIFELNGKRYSLSVMRDIRYRKDNEKRLQEALEREKRLHLQLQNEIKARIEFSRSLVHELRTPLTPILASVDMLLKLTPPGVEERLTKQIQIGAIELDERIGELFDVVRGEMGILEMQTLPMDPLKLIQEVVEFFQAVAEPKNIRLSAVIAELPKQIVADRKRLRQVLSNLLDNAIKYTPDDGKVTLSASSKLDRVIIEVLDTGIGISKPEQSHLFEPYFKIHNSSDNYSGLGLGLAISKTIINLHGGSIKVKSRPGNGSVFQLSIPVIAKPR
ncbi:sensory box sensor histidine kinase [Dehalogenimonas sp. WBC-2]|nr:sensory box sensor histidine kinase [Dehalogenimonas sp. WBC-2]